MATVPAVTAAGAARDNGGDNGANDRCYAGGPGQAWHAPAVEGQHSSPVPTCVVSPSEPSWAAPWGPQTSWSSGRSMPTLS